MSLADEEHGRLLALYRSRVADYADVDDDFRQRWSRWCRRLLTHGGNLVVPPMQPDADLDQLLTGAQPQGPAFRLLQGADNGCHANAAILWIDGTVAAIGTGYALSDDGLWRQHSWGIDAEGTLVETTFERRLYLGLALSDIAALQFAASNASDHAKAVLTARGPRAHELAAILHAARRAGT
ncbi:hypothetical protein [Micromonospora coerulea]|uniref:hypothetical protein n=1 Tax=Micromonospora coerulea TaxID=47856 RepID=UPI0019083BD9|nr:hypothetical protein [Micromonospora veneta]